MPVDDCSIPVDDYRNLTPKKTPFPEGNVKYIVPPEVQALANIARERTAVQLPPAQLAWLQQYYADKGVIWGSTEKKFQPRPIPGRVFLDKDGKPFTTPRVGAFEIRNSGI